MKDWTKLISRYGGKWVVFGAKDKVIEASPKLEVALKRFGKKFPNRRPSIFKVPRKICPYVG